MMHDPKDFVSTKCLKSEEKEKEKKKKITPFDCIKIRSLSIWPDTDQDILLTRNEANNRA